jgi:hypothetical protein
MVLPEPVAILLHQRLKSPPSDGISIPVLSASGASVNQINVSMASNWQKKNLRSLRSSGSCQCCKSRLVIPVTPG